MSSASDQFEGVRLQIASRVLDLRGWRFPFMEYSNPTTTERAQQSPLWTDLEAQQGRSLPYLLERYLLLENWRHLDRVEDSGKEEADKYDINYLHLLLADAVTVLLNQEHRIRQLEKQLSEP